MTDKQIIIDKLKNDVACKENIINHLAENNIKLQEQLTHKEQECERWKKANDEKNELLTKLGCPTMATAKRKVFCLQQQLDKLKAENEQLKEELSVIQHKYCDLLRTLAEIKEIAKYDVYTTRADLCLRLNWIKKKISECEGNND